MIADAITEDVTSAAPLRGMNLGDAQTSGPVSVFPLFLDSDFDGFPYTSLRRALHEGHLCITEVGSVQTVRLENLGDLPVLLLDGEEFTGAMQNRVISASTLLGAHSTIDAPVVCSQRSRWSFESREFGDSGVVAATKLRHRLRADTHASLHQHAGGRAHQGHFWQEVGELHERRGVSSATEAMRDAYVARESQLGEWLAGFSLEPDQHGILVMLGSQPIGLDLVSSAAVYADEHERLLTSYLLEAFDSDDEPGDPEAADTFVERIRGLGEGERFDASPGLGTSHCFAADGILGTALACQEQRVHAAFFDVGGATESADDVPVEHRPNWRISAARERARQPQAR